ncbi:E3 ubiquitin ligase BIG BROTHER -like protein [Gossypium arboreum]|uniref:RING-type E3 ubiquitin transferase n=1 Tax=Gossypium arboreum TaxID=29729 RepID=A0A0B0NVL5_GOSAR|nr:E3 ubiquitin ligase BIG BROTHER -like protein [Gossypium arboreum]
MGQRNMRSPIDLEIDQQAQEYLQHEPCIYLGGTTNYPSPDIPMTITAPGNTTNLDAHPLPEHYDNSMFYGIPMYPGVQHHHHSPNLDLGIGSASNFYQFNASSSSSSSVTPLNTRNPDGVGTVDTASFTRSQYRGNGLPPIREAGPQRSARNRLGANAVDPVLMQSGNPYFQGNYLGQPFQPTITDGGASAWTQAPGVPYMHGSNIGGPMETRHRSSSNFSHSPLDFLNPNFHHHVPPIEGARGHGINVHPQVAPVPYCFPASYASRSTMNPSQDGLDVGRRHFGPVPPTGFRIYHSRRESGALPETSLRPRNLPHLRVLPPDGVAVLEFPEFYEEVGNLIDHHRDMRLDIEDMSYEELLALGERIGNVNTGLSEEMIRRKLKTRSYSTFATNINLEEAAPVEQEPDFCTICQEDYKNQEKIGTLDCGHEYHASCLRKWLLLKNVCPICKSEALAT